MIIVKIDIIRLNKQVQFEPSRPRFCKMNREIKCNPIYIFLIFRMRAYDLS